MPPRLGKSSAAHGGKGAVKGKGSKRNKAIPFRVVDISEDMTPRKLADRMGVRLRHVFGMLADLGEKVSR